MEISIVHSHHPRPFDQTIFSHLMSPSPSQTLQNNDVTNVDVAAQDNNSWKQSFGDRCERSELSDKERSQMLKIGAVQLKSKYGNLDKTHTKKFPAALQTNRK
jgi:hypothetical protein